MRPYRLTEHTYVSASSQGAVFLDLHRDAYVGVDSTQSEALANLVECWPIAGSATTVPTASDRELAATLCEKGLLEAAPDDGSQPSHTHGCHNERLHLLPSVEDELIAWDRMPRVRISLHHSLMFLRALLIALWMLKCRSLFATARRFEERRRRVCAMPDRTLMCELLSVYTLIRMFAFGRRGRCLLDSVVLVEFLAAYGIHARWVLGVHIRPFTAHSWVQEAQFVLNGTPAFVRHFQPILVI
jgi:hypothetical protein